MGEMLVPEREGEREREIERESKSGRESNHKEEKMRERGERDTSRKRVC